LFCCFVGVVGFCAVVCFFLGGGGGGGGAVKFPTLFLWEEGGGYCTVAILILFYCQITLRRKYNQISNIK